MASSPRRDPGRGPARVVFRRACTSVIPTTISSSSPCTTAGLAPRERREYHVHRTARAPARFDLHAGSLVRLIEIHDLLAIAALAERERIRFAALRAVTEVDVKTAVDIGSCNAHIMRGTLVQ